MRTARGASRLRITHFYRAELPRHACLGQAWSDWLIWFVLFIWLIWLVSFNQTNETDQTNQITDFLRGAI